MPSSIGSSSESYHSDSSFAEEDDQDWADWVGDDDDDVVGDEGRGTMAYDATAAAAGPSSSSAAVGFRLPTRALFADEEGTIEVYDGPTQALRAAWEKQECDVVGIVHDLRLDAIQAIRLINHIRRNSLSPQAVSSLTGKEAFLNDDKELQPVEGLEDDGLLQIDFDEMQRLSQSNEGATGKAASRISDGAASRAQIEELQSELIATRLAFDELKKQYLSRIGLSSNVGQEAATSSSSSKDKPIAYTTSPIAGSSKTHSLTGSGRDDDTHYFNSYASNDIHQVMIEDTVRTLSYAQFILSPENAHLIRGKTVMDVGCGSGILSLFCARAGAKKVIAIDASDVADRARSNIEKNGWDHIIQVHKGKLENLSAELQHYEGKVDLLVSEWMGYFLLYESMLPSVLIARDRYLNRTTGLMAPSHCRMLLCALSDAELLHSRINFWNDIYGFQFPAMAKGLEDEAYTEVFSADKIVSDVVPIYDLPLQTMTAAQPTFVTPFSLECKPGQTIHGFGSWFDTWFIPLADHPALPSSAATTGQLKGGEFIDGLPDVRISPVQESEIKDIRQHSKGVGIGVGVGVGVESDVDGGQKSQGQGRTVSFTTGPYGKETHWKQTVFLLKEPIVIPPCPSSSAEEEEGKATNHTHTRLEGEIHVTTSPSNSRELDVEIHWVLRSPPTQAQTQTQTKGTQMQSQSQSQESESESESTSGGGGAQKVKKKVEARLVQSWYVR